MNPAYNNYRMSDQQAADYFRREYERANFAVEILEKHNDELKLEKKALQDRIKELEAGIIKFITTA